MFVYFYCCELSRYSEPAPLVDLHKRKAQSDGEELLVSDRGVQVSAINQLLCPHRRYREM